MEVLSQLLNTQFLFPATAVIAVLVCAIGVFAFGFKSAEQPAFDKLSSSSADDRKPAGKKRKIKEKKSTANGHATAVTEGAEVKASPSKKAAPVKEAPKETPSKVTKKPESVAAAPKAKTAKASDGKVVDVKNKKNLKQKQPEEKPLDYDDGTWETVPVKNDKKNRKTQDEPIIVKKDSPKKISKKGQDKNKKPNVDEQKDVDVLEHVIDNKEEVTKELKDKVNEQQKAAAEVEKNIEVTLTPVVIPDAETEPEPEAAITEDSVVITDDAKKKKTKKAKAKVDSVEVAKVVLPQSEAVPKKEKKEKKEKTDVVRPAKVAEQQVEVKTEPVTVPDKGVAFDELGDVWTEAKVPKKNKKKVRKE